MPHCIIEFDVTSSNMNVLPPSKQPLSPQKDVLEIFVEPPDPLVSAPFFGIFWCHTATPAPLSFLLAPIHALIHAFDTGT